MNGRGSIEAVNGGTARSQSTTRVGELARRRQANQDSVMYTTRAALRTIIPNRSGVIVNVSSLNGTRGFPDRASYGATKAAVINFTQTTAMENRLHGIRANCLVPGAIDGQRLRTLQGGMAAQPGQALVIGEAPRSRVQSLFGGSLTSF